MGKLVIIEGTDGSGKQTQSQLLNERLCNEGIKVKKISFPDYDSPSSSLVKMYLNGDLGKMHKVLMLMLLQVFMEWTDMLHLKPNGLKNMKMDML